MYLYLDECYNTGNNWMDKDQLFFTYGGWIISERNLSKAELLIREFSQHHQGELKSKSFTSHKGIREVIDLSTKMISDCEAKPYFMCFEKYFMIACKVVEIFFDHDTNQGVNGYLTFPNEYEYHKIVCKKKNLHIDFNLVKQYLPPIYITKRGLAEVIKQDEGFCSHVGEILNGTPIDEDGVLDIINKLQLLFSVAGFENIASIFNPENFNLSDICDELQSEMKIDEETYVSKSILVQPSLYEMINGLKGEYKNLKIIVDTLGNQNSQFSEISNLLKVPIEIRNDSNEDMMIMASDLLVGQFARLFKEISLGSKDIAESELKLLKHSFIPRKSQFEEEPSYWYCKFSHNTWNILGDALGLKIDNIDYTSVLKSKFNIFTKTSSGQKENLQLKLFDMVDGLNELHPKYELLKNNVQLINEKNMIEAWTEGFVDRDHDIVYKFQNRFHPSFWEFYLYAVLSEYKFVLNQQHNRPDFMIIEPVEFYIEARVAEIKNDGVTEDKRTLDDQMSMLHSVSDQSDFDLLLNEAIVRYSNALQEKNNLYNKKYKELEWVKEDKPFIVALASFDQINYGREFIYPMIALLYGWYYDPKSESYLKKEHINKPKSNSKIPIGLFDKQEYENISAVLFSCTLTLGKLTSLVISQNNMGSPFNRVFTIRHDSEDFEFPYKMQIVSEETPEYIDDGLFLFHNPNTKCKFDRKLFKGTNIVQVFIEDNQLHIEGENLPLVSRFNTSKFLVPDVMVEEFVIQTMLKYNGYAE